MKIVAGLPSAILIHARSKGIVNLGSGVFEFLTKYLKALTGYINVSTSGEPYHGK